MLEEKDPKDCEIYGCRNLKTDDAATITIAVGDGTETLTVCDDHLLFFQATDPALYEIGYTYRRSVEVRLLPAAPIV